MSRAVTVIAGCALAGACTFSPKSLPLVAADAASSDVAPVDSPLPVDAQVVDASPVDSRPPDASFDATPDLCPVASTPLSLGVATAGTITRSSSLFARGLASCKGDGPEDFYHVDLTGQDGSAELVVDLDDKSPVGGVSMDGVGDVNLTCTTTGTYVCADNAGPAGGEFVVFPNVTNGRKYVVIDTYDLSSVGDGKYSVKAGIRTVQAPHQTCDPALFQSRCPSGYFCVDSTDTATLTTTCEQPSTQLEASGNNGTACNATPAFAVDGVFSGTMASESDIDYIQLDPAADRGALITLYTRDGTCDLDLRLDYYAGAACGTVAFVAGDDNSGIGECPVLRINRIDHTLFSALRISVGNSNPVFNNPANPTNAYTVVIDYLPPI